MTTLQNSSLKTLRENKMLSKAELARKAGVSPLTIERIERGGSCRPESLKKIILALGYTIEDRTKLFSDIAVFAPAKAAAVD